MPAPNIILNSGEVLIQQTDSGLGIIPIDGKTAFGVVVAVYETSDKTNVGDYIMYEPSKIRQIMYGSTIYGLIKEKDISGSEIIPP